ncbi:ATP-binding protein [Microbacterium sp. VKM Ac-2870]|uniref:ATP-binding protein n=1 Tax=Microbacterium sp. VKM Ac-2870 TaxID=2783825 RepID=UPI00188C5CA9|nr:ATP-binding protein [Microbacterium sp. VKM Ac-2870]MBF4562861.1 ATP-binding protein [Microbacterium sp. VKM Ac-2870]
MTPAQLYGRQSDRDAVASRTGVVLVTGDSGIGKTAFLGILNTSQSSGDLVADVQVLRSTNGALRNAIATALGDCLLQSAQDETRQRLVWERVKSSVLRAATAAQKELGRMLITRATEVVEAKIGKEATTLIRGVVDEVLLPPRARFEEQLTAFTVPDAAAEIGRLVRDVALATEQTLVFPMDAAERLGRDDRDLLVELSTELGPHVRLIVTANNHQAEGQELQRLLEGRNSKPHELGPLSHHDVEDWLLAEGVARNQWFQIIRIADGYPLFVNDAIRLAQSGLSLSTIETPTSFQSVFEHSFRRLDAGMQSRISQIAAFADPPPDDYLAEYLGLSEFELLIFEQKLLDEGVFIRRPDGVNWFHDRRRAYLWNTRLTTKHRQAVATAVLESFRRRLEQKPVIEAWLAVSSPAILAEADVNDLDPDVSRVVQTPTDQLALLASMIELMEPGQNQTASTREIAAYASRRFSFSGDPIAALEALEERGMVALASNRYASVAAPVIPSNFAYAALIGEAQHRFGLQLIPGRALRSFEAFIKPLLGRFDRARISLQRGTLADHSATFRDETATNGTADRRRSVCGLGITLTIDDQPVSVTALFEDSADRIAARASLTDGFQSSPARNHFQLERIDDLPASRVRYGRYKQLMEDHQLERMTVPIHSQSELADLLYKRSVATEVLASSLDDYEAAALGLDRGRRFILDIRGEPKSAAVFEIETARAAPTVTAAVVSEVSLLDDPLIELRLRAQGLISAEERLVRWTIHTETRNQTGAATETIDNLIEQGRKFNRHLPRVPIRLDANVLEEDIRQEMATLSRLEDELVQGGLLQQRLASREDSLLVLLDSAEPSNERWYPWGASTFWTSDGCAQIHVRVLPEGIEPPSIFARGPELAKAGVKDASNVTRSGSGIASAELSRLLGYESEDVAIQDPRFPGYI